MSLQSFEVTPAIGREFKDLQLAELLDAPNSDELIRDLAITGSYARIGSLANCQLIQMPVRSLTPWSLFLPGPGAVPPANGHSHCANG